MSCERDFVAEDKVSECMRTLANAPFAQSLRHVFLIFCHNDLRVDTDSNIGLGAFRPLKKCHSLTVLRVMVDTIAPSVDGCQVIASACPQLKVLELSDGKDREERKQRATRKAYEHRSEYAAPLDGLAIIVRGAAGSLTSESPCELEGHGISRSSPAWRKRRGQSCAQIYL